MDSIMIDIEQSKAQLPQKQLIGDNPNARSGQPLS
jgi:hypothetical protein